MNGLNTFSGVFVPSFEAILGAVLFLILPLLVAALGFQEMLIVVLLANSATLATAFSIADCATNLNRIGAGGMYAISKRSLGRAFGGSIGIQLYLAQAISIGFYAIGFAEPLQPLLVRIPGIAAFVADAGLSVLVQKQILASLISLLALGVALAGGDLVSRVQLLIFVALILAVAAVFAAPLFGPTLDGQPVFSDQFNRDGGPIRIGFWVAFATFFPAVTGIDAGVGMSGSLANPRRSLGRGTFLAIGVTTLIYVGVTFVFGWLDPARVEGPGGATRNTLELFLQTPFIPWVLLAGILLATGSSALSYLVTAPRTAQALARDNLLPRALGFLGHGLGANSSEPFWATLLTFGISVGVVWSGDIAFISLVVGIAFLVVYGWVNLAAFFERISGNPSFRPTSRGHWLISLYGFVICMAVIALFNLWVGLGVLASQMTIFYLLLRYRSANRLEGVWWGLVFKVLQWSVQRTGRIVQGTKNWRPVVGVFSFCDDITGTEATAELAQRISQFKGLTLTHILRPREVNDVTSGIPDGAALIESPTGDHEHTVLSLVQSPLPGNLSINTVLLTIDRRLELMDLIESLMNLSRHVLLFKHDGKISDGASRIDVWWKGAENGNLMALLAFIITQSDRAWGRPVRPIRLVRKLMPNDDVEQAEADLRRLMDGARLAGETLVLPADDVEFVRTVHQVSGDAALVLLGMPGKPAAGIRKVFRLDERFLKRQFAQYADLPPTLFVKAAGLIDLVETD